MACVIGVIANDIPFVYAWSSLSAGKIVLGLHPESEHSKVDKVFSCQSAILSISYEPTWGKIGILEGQPLTANDSKAHRTVAGWKRRPSRIDRALRTVAIEVPGF